MDGLVEGKQLQDAVNVIRRLTNVRPRVALILGSGLGDFAKNLHVNAVISSSEIPNYPRSTVEGHEGKLIFGTIGSTSGSKPTSSPLLIFKGRIHYYETASLTPVLFPVQVAAALGAKILIVTNAAGGINRTFKAGDLMLIRDIISLSFVKFTFQDDLMNFQVNPYNGLPSGKNSSRDPFDSALQSLIRSSAEMLGIGLQEGTYCWLKGPTYETAAEIEMLRKIGSDAVGMSTVPEIFMANKLGLRVAGISLISNLATGITGKKLSHTEVTETAHKVKFRFSRLMKAVLSEL